MTLRKGELIIFTEKGIYCPVADVYIDPWRPVDRAVITHAHSDHARPGHRYYLAHHHSEWILKLRLGDINLETMEYGESRKINGVKISLHPAGHIIGSSQVRLEYQDQVTVITGDLKVEDDGLSTPFEPVKADSLVIESTFGLPVYKWEPQEIIFDSINQWWAENRSSGNASILCGYALGKAQRILHNIDSTAGPVYVHGAVENVNKALKNSVPDLKIFPKADKLLKKEEFRNSLIITPSSALNTPWIRKFSPYRTAIASGWMAIRGARRRRAVDRGFVLSDHADWKQLNEIVKETGASNVYVTHGYTYEFSRWLSEKGLNALEVNTFFEGELDEINEQADQ